MNEWRVYADEHRALMAALYLRGGPGAFAGQSPAPAARWPAVLRLLRAHCGRLESAAELLLRHHCWEEASVLRYTPRLDWAWSLVHGGGDSAGDWAVTAACPDYPAAWRDRLGDRAVPALYGRGPRAALADLTSGARADAARLGSVAVVGSRELTSEVTAWAEAVGAACVGAGATVISGGARGADQAAVRGALACLGARDFEGGARGGGRRKSQAQRGALVRESGGAARAYPAVAVEILPYGLDRHEAGMSTEHAAGARDHHDRILRLSTVTGDYGFQTALAMERNALIYSLADVAVIVHARMGVGGTWTGARECLRRKFAPLIVRVPAGARGGSVVGKGLAAEIKSGDGCDVDRGAVCGVDRGVEWGHGLGVDAGIGPLTGLAEPGSAAAAFVAMGAVPLADPRQLVDAWMRAREAWSLQTGGLARLWSA